MTITSQGALRLSLLLLLVTIAGSPLFAGWRFDGPAPKPLAKIAPGSDDDEKTHVIDLRRSGPVDVIIELNAQPLLVAGQSRDVQVASASLDASLEQLATDLARIEGATPDRIAAQAREAVTLRHTYKMVFAGASTTVDRSSLAAVRALPYVRAVHADGKVEAHLARSVPHIGVPQVWQNYGTKGKGITVAILDTGINYEHWALGEGFGPGFKVAGGWDVYNNDADPMDDHGHGTHVAGIVAASHKYLTGVAPEATLLAYKVLGADGFSHDSIILAGIEKAMDPNGDGNPSDRPDVINMSLGGPAEYNDPVIAAVERGVAAGTVFAVSAGNNFGELTLGAPAAAPSAITVAATEIPDRIALFSSGGPVGGTWAVKPEVAAPGVSITSSVLDDKTQSASGTSMASPHVAGVAALLLSKHPDWTPNDVKAALMSTAKPLPHRNNSEGMSVVFGGGGLIDVPRAMAATVFPSPASVSFGIVPNPNAAYTSTSMVKLTNRGASTETLTAKKAHLPGAAKLTIVPETFTLAPGASQDVQLTLEIPAGMEPNDTEILIAGKIDFNGGDTKVQVPLMVVRTDMISVTYAGDEEFDIYLSDGQGQARMWAAGPRTFAALVPRLLASDVMIATPATETSDAKLIIRERQTVEGVTEITILPEEAKHLVRIEGVDERGVPLSQLDASAPSVLWNRFLLPSLSNVKLVHDNRRMRMGPFKATRMQTYETLLTGTDRYFAGYRHIKKLQQDETLSVQPSDWASQKVVHHCKTDCTALIAAGPGSPQLHDYHPLPAAGVPWTLHITPQTEPNYDFRAYTMVREKDFTPNRAANPWTYLVNSMRNTNGRMAMSPMGRATKGDYFAPNRETPIQVGDGPQVLRMSGSFWLVELQAYGMLGETIGDNRNSISATVERTDGGAAGMQSTGWVGQYYLREERGPYKLVATNEYSVAGRPGLLTQTSHYDTRLGNDLGPSLSVFRIENGRGEAMTTVMAQSRARLVFAARQSTVTNASWDVTHSRVNAAATQVWWRRHGTTEWLPLPVTHTGEDYEWRGEFPGSPGTMFEASLVDAVGAEGEIDLKVFLQNGVGGTTEAVYEPAFVVGPAGAPRRRPMR